MSAKKYVKGQAVESILDFIAFCDQDKKFIKQCEITDPTYLARHPRAEQEQSAAFMKSQQFWIIQRWIAKRYLFVAEPIDKEF